MNSPVVPISTFIDGAQRFIFFTGKGGVGKTTLSCATAVALADRGRRVLLISTDPASNLSEVLGCDLASKEMDVPLVQGLRALNIDPQEAAREYREQMVAPYRGVMPAAMVASIEEQLSGACTTEIAAFNEFSRYLGQPDATANYDHVVFDTAPTGHTLRLLQLPAAWNGFLDNNSSGTSCLGPLAGLREQHALYARTLECLSDASRTMVALVSRPERSALSEAERSRSELGALGISNIHLMLNGLFETAETDPVAHAMSTRQRSALAGMPLGLSALSRSNILLRAFNMTGLDSIRAILNPVSIPLSSISPLPALDSTPQWPELATLVDEIERRGSGVVLVMGKGGVGKTTIAAAIAVALSSRGHRTHLTTTDPAAHIEQTVGDAVANLTTRRIDPASEVAAYAQEVMATAGADLDENGRNLLEEDLRSPCTEEIAVFRAFAAKVDAGRDGFIVLDTAPTGHTLLLLDATEAYHREVLRTQSELPDAVQQLLPRLRDPEFSKVILVTLPEATPVHEAMELQADLGRAGIQPFAWVVNQSLAPLVVHHPLLRARQDSELRYIAEVKHQTGRFVVCPWLTKDPTGAEGLRQLTTTRTESANLEEAS